MKSKTIQVFKSSPEKYNTEAERVGYEKNELKRLIFKYPFTYSLLCISPWVLLPDLPTFCQDLKITTTGRGTFDIINTKGIITATKYYFKGKMWVFAITAPLLIIVLITYIACFLQFIKWVFQKQWFLIFTALAFIEYYLFLPGPITMPRYQLPALPMMCVMAAMFIVLSINKQNSR